MKVSRHEGSRAPLAERAHLYLTPVTIALIYAVCGIIWILVSDRAATRMSGGGETFFHTVTRLQRLGFVLASAVVLFVLQRVGRSALIASERRHRAMFERTSAVALLLDPRTGLIVDANDAAAAFYGWSREELVGRPLADLTELPEGMLAQRMLEARSGDGVHFVSRHRTAAGTTRHVEVYPSPLDVHGRQLLFAIVHDLTGRLEAEHALEASESRYRTLLLEASDGIFVADAGGRYLDINPKGCQMLGYTREEMLNFHMADLVPAEDLSREPFRFQELFDGQTVLQERRLRRKDGTFLHAEISCRLREDGCMQGIVRDISRRRQLEERLRQAQKMEAIGQLTGGIAHDLNNVLGIVIANAELIRHAVPADREDVHRDIEDIKRSAHRGAGMIRKLLGFSRQSVLELVALDLTAALTDVLDMLRRLLPTDIAIERVGFDQPLPVRADRTAIEQIVMNLATNARDAMPHGGTLSVSLGRIVLGAADGVAPGDYACVTIRDTGHGMREEVLARVFDPFFTTKPPSQGSGLGMAMVYGLVRQQSGTIRIDSAPDAGTTVTICLPSVTREALGQEPREAQRVLPRGAETILLVEDEAALRIAASRILERLGYTVLTAADGEEALQFFGEGRQPIDLVVSDIMMPKRSGRALYEELRARNSAARFLFSSGYTGSLGTGVAEPHGGPQLLQKPWTAEELAVKVREVLDDAATALAGTYSR